MTNSVPSSLKNIDPNILSVAFRNRDLCTRCGTCIGACPSSAISVGPDFFPLLDPAKCTKCAICKKTCPGGEVNFQQLSSSTFETLSDNPSFDGHVLQTFVGYAANQRLRALGAGGGVVSGLLADLLNNNDISGCLVTRMNPAAPWLGESFIASNIEELYFSQGSKYAVIPHNQVLQTIRDKPGCYAFAGLPCQIHGLRLLMKEDPKIKEKIALIVGIFCGGALEPCAVTDMLKTRGLSSEEIKDFQFRGGDWPGKMRAILKDGRIIDMHYGDYKDGAYNYLAHLYAPMRCLTCIDGSSQFADISVGDVWTRDRNGKYRFEAHSRILVRTNLGAAVLKRAIERRSIIASDVTNDPDYRTHRAHTKRKGSAAPLRIKRLAAKGKEVPLYDRTLDMEPLLSERLAEISISYLNKLSQNRTFRYWLTKFLLSKYTIPLILIRRFLKKQKYKQ